MITRIALVIIGVFGQHKSENNATFYVIAVSLPQLCFTACALKSHLTSMDTWYIRTVLHKRHRSFMVSWQGTWIATSLLNTVNGNAVPRANNKKQHRGIRAHVLLYETCCTPNRGMSANLTNVSNLRADAIFASGTPRISGTAIM